MMSRWPYWCPKTMKQRPCWCPKLISQVSEYSLLNSRLVWFPTVASRVFAFLSPRERQMIELKKTTMEAKRVAAQLQLMARQLDRLANHVLSEVKK